MKTLRDLMLSLVACGMLGSPARAWDGVKTGKITGVDVTDGQTFGFRIYMDGTPICKTSEAWAFINKDFNNYDALVALLTSAYLSGKTVVIYTTAEGPYCRIGYAAFR